MTAHRDQKPEQGSGSALLIVSDETGRASVVVEKRLSAGHSFEAFDVEGGRAYLRRSDGESVPVEFDPAIAAEAAALGSVTLLEIDFETDSETETTISASAHASPGFGAA
jgi:hypothetical protein